MKKLLAGIIAVIALVSLSACEEIRGAELVFAELTFSDDNGTSPELTIKAENYLAVTVPIAEVKIIVNEKRRKPFVLGNYNYNTDGFTITEINLLTLEDLATWKKAIEDKKPVVLYPKPE